MKGWINLITHAEGNEKWYSNSRKELAVLFFFKLNLRLPNDTVIILLGICPREMKTCVHIHKNSKLYVNVYSSLIHDS